MEIEKRKVTEAKPLSVAAKSAITAALGLTVASTFIACGGDSVPNDFQDPESSDDSTLTSSDTAPTSTSEDSQPSSSNATTGDEATPESSSATETLQSSSEQAEAQQSSSEQAETSQSSSSQVVVDIPLSHEHISSSVMEALSAAAESDSSANNRCIAVPGSEITVCTQTPSSSSSSNAQSSSSSANNACTNVPGSDIIICPDQSLPHSSAMTSMVTTFEKTDIEV